LALILKLGLPFSQSFGLDMGTEFHLTGASLLGALVAASGFAERLFEVLLRF
jgi:hypothetical protein